jgi:DNA-binding NarL/FixJ family response regulator
MQNSMKNIYNIFCAENGQNALKKLNYIPKPHLIISDIMMDVMDGYSFVAELNKLPEYNTIPFIFLTARYSSSERIKGLSVGAIDFISKPFVIEELILKIQTIIKISNSLDKKRIVEMEKSILEYLGKEKKVEIPENNHRTFKFEQVSERLYDQYNITSREIKIISMLVEKLMYKEIAYELNISINTVRTHIKHIYKKLNISSSNELRKIFIALAKTV